MEWLGRRIPLSASVITAAAWVLGGCTEPSCPDWQPTDAGPLVVGSILYACSWPDTTDPRTEPLLLDVCLPSLAPPDQSLDPLDVAALYARGAQVTHVFQFPAARIRVLPRDLPRIRSLSLGAFALSVPDSTRFDWEFVVSYRSTFTEVDSLCLVRLGARVLSVLRYDPDFVVADLSDAALPYVRRANHVKSVSVGGFACILDDGAVDRPAAPTYTRSNTIAAP